MYKVSVVIPIYNAEKYLRECLESIRNQTLKEIEVILVDDGSTDGSIDILNEYIHKDDRFFLIKQKNQYAGVARNNGMKKACGEYVSFLDADDFFEPTMLEDMYVQAKENDSDIVLCDARFFNDKTKEISEPSWVLHSNFLNDCGKVFSYKDIPDRIFNVSWGTPWNKLFRKEFISKHELKFQPIKRHNDEFFVCMSMVLAQRISFVDKRLVYYRINNDNSLQAYSEKEERPYGFYVALSSVRRELMTKGIYFEMERGFVNKCISSCVSLLNKQKDVYSFLRIFNFLKNEGFKGLGITNQVVKFLYSDNEEYQNIMNSSAIEYLFQKVKKLQKSQGEKYVFPYAELGKSRRIAIYGAGEVGKSYYKQIMDSNYYQLVAWFDKNYNQLCKKGLSVVDPNDILIYEFEKLVIAIKDAEIYQQIKKQLVACGIREEDIAWKV